MSRYLSAVTFASFLVASPLLAQEPAPSPAAPAACCKAAAGESAKGCCAHASGQHESHGARCTKHGQEGDAAGHRGCCCCCRAKHSEETTEKQ